MNDIGEAIVSMINIALCSVNDNALKDVLAKVQNAERDYLIAETNARRTKSSELIRSIAKLDIEKTKLINTYNSIESGLSDEAKIAVERVINDLNKQRNQLVIEKRRISNVGNFNHYKLTNNETNVYGVKLKKGDILAVTRKGGIYQHYAVYVGNNRVIHYAAEKGDFSGKISIHEAPFSEFQAGDMLVYVLDFPDDEGMPIQNGKPLQYNMEEHTIFEAIRKQGYHLYSPDETVERAQSRIGEESYSLPFNNCEHFAIWCKTGVKESHQVNQWLTRIINAGKQIVLF